MGVKFGVEEATTLNADVQKIAKIGKHWGFFAARGRQNKPIETKVQILVQVLSFIAIVRTRLFTPHDL